MAADLKTAVAANDRLLKALITLLTIRDPSLLGELEEIFGKAAAEGNPLGLAMPDVWQEIHRELGLIGRMVEDSEEADGVVH